ncbi:MAG: iron-containing alcohol dehydrogenase [Butyrivibrio sp.]|nr:iron-containing alcohol dehydrogenase [Acetatifactor muris]MCM1559113.1 iron-containing alcohol dehydrogenase [Butyrivibrio sp.]
MSSSFIMPKQIISGAGALKQAEESLKGLGKKALVVTDEVMIRLGNLAHVEEALKNCGISYAVYSGISGEPTDAMIAEGLALYQKEGCDFLAALGGGSPIDSMKAIGALVGNGGLITDYLGKVIEKPTPPMVAVPTTAGTGSEATQFTIITDTKRDIKMLLKGAVLMPTLAVIDPQFTVTAPPAITAATGLDALTHAVESYTSAKAQPLSDVFALSAVKRIFTWLPEAFRNGGNVQAREEMSLAALEAGIAFNNASVTIVHGMSRPIGALFHVPHGISNAMLLEKCLSYVLDGAYDRFGRLGREIGVAAAGAGDREAGESFLGAVADICRTCEIPTLQEYGIDRESYVNVIEKMTEDAMASGSPSNTRKKIGPEDVRVIYESLYK